MKTRSRRLLSLAMLALWTAPSLAADYTIKAGSTDVTVYMTMKFYGDSEQNESPETGLAYNSLNLKAYYVRTRGAATPITLVTQTVTGTHTDGGFKEVDATNMPGIYRLDLPDAACAVGATSARVTLYDADNGKPFDVVDIDLVAYDPSDGNRLGLAYLPNAAPGSANGVLTYGTGTGQLNMTGGSVRIVDGTGTGEIDTSSGKVALAAAEHDQMAREAGRLHLDAVDTVNSQTSFSLAEGPGSADVANGMLCKISRSATPLYGFAVITDTDGINISIDRAMPFTAQAGDIVEIFRISPQIADIRTDAAAIKAKSDFLPSATAGTTNGLAILDASGNVQADVEAVDDDTTAPPNLELAYDGTGYAGGTTKQIIDVPNGELTASVFDGSTAFPLTSADNSTTRIARTGADSDTLETLSDQIDNVEAAIDDAPTFAEAMDDQGYTTPRAEKIDTLAPSLLVSSTINDATVAVTQTSFALAAGPANDDALNGALIIVTDDADPMNVKKAVGLVKDYDHTTKTVTLVADPGTFEFANGDKVDVIAGGTAIPLWLSGN